MLQKDESYRIIGACFEVYNTLGTGFLESAYQEALELEFREREIPFEREVPLNISYKNSHLKTTYQADFVCFNSIIIETKTAKAIAPEHKAQAIHYLRATGYSLAIIANFGNPQKFESERLVNSIRENSRHSLLTKN